MEITRLYPAYRNRGTTESGAEETEERKSRASLASSPLMRVGSPRSRGSAGDAAEISQTGRATLVPFESRVAIDTPHEHADDTRLPTPRFRGFSQTRDLVRSLVYPPAFSHRRKGPFFSPKGDGYIGRIRNSREIISSSFIA